MQYPVINRCISTPNQNRLKMKNCIFNGNGPQQSSITMYALLCVRPILIIILLS